MRTGRKSGGRMRASGALAHLLLVVVLALGVFVMHSVGHPEGSSGSGAADRTAHAASVTHAGAVTHAAAVTGPTDVSAPGISTDHASAPDVLTYDASDASSVHASHASAPASSEGAEEGAEEGAHHGTSSSHGSGTGTDMTTLCVAVLGAWLLVALVRAALARRPDRTAPLLGGLLPALGPHAPPPRPPSLARLSVLRI
ncbi:hypothetical protein [Streptomyces sp. NPDC059071]|uniref:hypothetical protein n=1 Tax=unclassified Streptomyces TaxID=2593676 RepID=UPI00364DF733